MQITNISDAKSSLSKLIEQVLQGQEVIIGKAGKPVAMLVPYDAETSPRKLGAGSWRDKIWIADDFDDLSDCSSVHPHPRPGGIDPTQAPADEKPSPAGQQAQTKEDNRNGQRGG